MEVESILIKLDYHIEGLEIWGLYMGFNGDISVLIMGLVRMNILGKGLINWLGSWILLRIIQLIGGLSCLLGTQRVSSPLFVHLLFFISFARPID
jgi:hypothetical protein